MAAQSFLMMRSQDGSDGHGTLGGYVLFAVNSDYRRLVEAVFTLKQTA